MTTQEILEAARAAKQAVALASSRTRQRVLERMADALCAPDRKPFWPPTRRTWLPPKGTSAM